MHETEADRFPYKEFPTGWFAVAGSHEVAAGAVKPLHNFGVDLVLFRTEAGQAGGDRSVLPASGGASGLWRTG